MSSLIPHTHLPKRLFEIFENFSKTPSIQKEDGLTVYNVAFNHPWERIHMEFKYYSDMRYADNLDFTLSIDHKELGVKIATYTDFFDESVFLSGIRSFEPEEIIHPERVFDRINVLSGDEKHKIIILLRMLRDSFMHMDSGLLPTEKQVEYIINKSQACKTAQNLMKL